MVHDASVIVRERKRVIVTQHSDLSGRNEMETDVEYARLESCVTSPEQSLGNVKRRKKKKFFSVDLLIRIKMYILPSSINLSLTPKIMNSNFLPRNGGIMSKFVDWHNEKMLKKAKEAFEKHRFASWRIRVTICFYLELTTPLASHMSCRVNCP